MRIGTCPACRLAYSVRTDGTMRKHLVIRLKAGYWEKMDCEGSGKTAKEKALEIPLVVRWSDDRLRAFWIKNGGKFHGPNVETGTMTEAKLLPFLRLLLCAASKEP